MGILAVLIGMVLSWLMRIHLVWPNFAIPGRDGCLPPGISWTFFGFICFVALAKNLNRGDAGRRWMPAPALSGLIIQEASRAKRSAIHMGWKCEKLQLLPFA